MNPQEEQLVVKLKRRSLDGMRGFIDGLLSARGLDEQQIALVVASLHGEMVRRLDEDE